METMTFSCLSICELPGPHWLPWWTDTYWLHIEMWQCPCQDETLDTGYDTNPLQKKAFCLQSPGLHCYCSSWIINTSTKGHGLVLFSHWQTCICMDKIWNKWTTAPVLASLVSPHALHSNCTGPPSTKFSFYPMAIAKSWVIIHLLSHQANKS